MILICHVRAKVFYFWEKKTSTHFTVEFWTWGLQLILIPQICPQLRLQQKRKLGNKNADRFTGVLSHKSHASARIKWRKNSVIAFIHWCVIRITYPYTNYPILYQYMYNKCTSPNVSTSISNTGLTLKLSETPSLNLLLQNLSFGNALPKLHRYTKPKPNPYDG